ncbi:LysR substrate-binding domain-containing protein [Xanthobacter autotrophicus DSM 431]|uniref:LysR substrate-binding domain-containing protein n=1 Tax=Xanthobacter nonsaccharivorans TaxID=3119912 RepID=UPI003728CF61
MMELRDFEFLQAVAQTGSITRAAQELGCVQSNVTTRLKKLEARLGQRLVERIDGRMVPTASGSLALDFGARIFRLSQEAETLLKSAAEALPPLRIGTMETTAAVRLPALLKAVRAALPKLRLQLRSGTSGELVAALKRGALDLVLVAEEAADERFSSRILWREELVEVLPPGGAAEDALVVFREGCCYRERCRATFGEAPVLELGTLDGIIGCVSAGLGRTLLPASAVERWRALGEVTTRPLAAGAGAVATIALWRAASPSRASIAAVLDLAARLPEASAPRP